MTSISNPTPAEILAVAEDERHTLLAGAARDHLSNVRSETRRYEEQLEHIESVFQMRIQPVSDVPEWITAARKDDIAAAIRLVDSAGDITLAAWLAKTSDPGPGVSRAFLRRQLARAASEPARVYPSWLAAVRILKAAGL